MVMILPQRKNFGSMLGQLLGDTALGHLQGLNEVQASKAAQQEQLRQEARQRVPQQYWNKLGYNPDESAFLSQLPTAQATKLAGQFAPGQSQQQPQFAQAMQELSPQAQQRDNKLLTALLNPQPMGMNLNQGFNIAGNRPGPQPQVSGQQPAMKPQPMQQPEQRGGLFRKQLTEDQLAKQEIAQQKIRDAQQKQIDTSNKKYLEGFSKAKANATKALEDAQRIKELVATGNVRSGFTGAVGGEWFPNTETQQFIAHGNSLASTLLSQYGVPTAGKIKFAQSQKPSVAQTVETQLKLADEIEKGANKVLLQSDIQDQLIEDNDGRQPANFERKVEKRFKEVLDTPPDVPEKVFNGKEFVDIEDGDEVTDKYGQLWLYDKGKMVKRK